MRYMLLAFSLLVLVYHSVTAAQLQVQQKPRFYGVKVGKDVRFLCSATDRTLKNLVGEWYKINGFDEVHKVSKNELSPLAMDTRAVKTSGPVTGQLIIKKVQVEDGGIYYCKMNGTWGHGTELQVFRHSDVKAAARRSNLKDFIIFLQAFILLLCIVLPLVKWNTLKKKEEIVYEEPKDDHTYEGLAIENCTDLYEELNVFSPNQEGEAEWQVESPEQQ